MRRVLVTFIALAILYPLPILARIINIPDDYTSIQAGINASVDGDTVLVAPGTYHEQIDILLKDIILGSLFLTTGDRSYIESTIIDADTLGTVVSIRYCGEHFLFEGFTVTNGNNRLYGAGGINCVRTIGTIRSNILSGNRARYGGALFCDASDVQINGNVIVYNYCSYGYDYGAAISCRECGPSIFSNVIYGNTTNIRPFRNGGVLGFNQGSFPLLRNNIIWGNIPNGISCDDLSGAEVEYCIIQNGWDGQGNIDADPLLIDPRLGNYNVYLQSPCIDSGTPYENDPDGSRSDIGIFFPVHENHPAASIKFVSISGNDTSGNGSWGSPFRSIQHAVDVSSYGDTILVENGIYHENVRVLGTSRVLASNYIYSGDTLDILNTVVDGDSLDTVISLNGCDSLMHVRGLTIRNGLGSGDEGYIPSGGIECGSANALIADNIIVANNGVNYGGGIFCRNSRAKIFNNKIIDNNADIGGGINCEFASAVISGNTVRGNIGKWDGGISCMYGDALIERNEVSENIATGITIRSGRYKVIDNVISGNMMPAPHYWPNAGGIYSDNVTGSIIKGNRIEGNTAISAGGGISCSYYEGDICYNVILNNIGHYSGGGLRINGTMVNLFNNIICGNSAIMGGGLIVSAQGAFLRPSRNNVFSGNIADTGGAIYCVWDTVVVENSIFWGDTAMAGSEIFPESLAIVSYSDIQGGFEGVQNIATDPLFRNQSAGDYHLMATSCGDISNSPCIDTGNPDIIDNLFDCAWGLGTSLSDMGAYGGGDSLMVRIEEERSDNIPVKFELSQNYPNPFNSQTTIQYSLQVQADVTLEIFDILGRKIAALAEGIESAGKHQATWDAHGQSSGIYFYKITAGDKVETKRMLLVK